MHLRRASPISSSAAIVTSFVIASKCLVADELLVHSMYSSTSKNSKSSRCKIGWSQSGYPRDRIRIRLMRPGCLLKSHWVLHFKNQWEHPRCSSFCRSYREGEVFSLLSGPFFPREKKKEQNKIDARELHAGSTHVRIGSKCNHTGCPNLSVSLVESVVLRKRRKYSFRGSDPKGQCHQTPYRWITTWCWPSKAPQLTKLWMKLLLPGRQKERSLLSRELTYTYQTHSKPIRNMLPRCRDIRLEVDTCLKPICWYCQMCCFQLDCCCQVTLQVDEFNWHRNLPAEFEKSDMPKLIVHMCWPATYCHTVKAGT